MRSTAVPVACAPSMLAVASGRRAAQTPDSLAGVSSAKITYAAGADLSFLKAAEDRGVHFWADPGKQWAPAAWDTTNLDALVDAVYPYTRGTIEAFREAGVMPEMVQIGNEVRNGMIWPLGRLPGNRDNFARLFKAGLDGIDAGRGQSPHPLIMLHYDQGADEGRDECNARPVITVFDRFKRY